MEVISSSRVLNIVNHSGEKKSQYLNISHPGSKASRWDEVVGCDENVSSVNGVVVGVTVQIVAVLNQSAVVLQVMQVYLGGGGIILRDSRVWIKKVIQINEQVQNV